MVTQELLTRLAEAGDSKIVMLVADGLGGLPTEPGGPTELEAAATPNLDALVAAHTCGLTIPIGRGITPGSGPGHLGIFGYDPLRYDIGRGVLEALGIDFEMTDRDVATRGNFCTIDGEGLITDRRAGRIPNETCERLCEKLQAICIPEVEIIVRPVREHRLVIVFRGEGLQDNVADTDPQATGVAPLSAVAADAGSQLTAEVANRFLAEARKLLADEHPANMVNLRGFARYPDIPTFQEAFKLRACAIAVYPMYRGLAKLVGMTAVDAGQTLAEQIDRLASNWDDFDFFFVHFKYTDSRGEDGDFGAKVEQVEVFDAVLPKVLDLKPDVLLVTGDHSTPSALASHSWHPVPTILAAPTCRPDRVTSFGDRDCIAGGLGQFPAQELMALALAHAGRLGKYGA